METRAMRQREHDVTQALIGAAAGDKEAADILWQLTYDELHRIAQRHLMRERPDHTLSATALVHEAYIRLVDQDRIEWQNRAHFFSVASQVCRRILVDYARKRRAQKRGSAPARVTLEDNLASVDNQTEEILALNEALDHLAVIDERLAKLVECRYFGGLSEQETAEALGVSERTVRRDWVKAKGWLYQFLNVEGKPEDDAADAADADSSD
jgi:RNA polymerase sigma factor (TIGR02999 family)